MLNGELVYVLEGRGNVASGMSVGYERFLKMLKFNEDLRKQIPGINVELDIISIAVKQRQRLGMMFARGKMYFKK